MSEPKEEALDVATTTIYRIFKSWGERKFSADDVTWCEVRAALSVALEDAIRTLTTGAQP